MSNAGGDQEIPETASADGTALIVWFDGRNEEHSDVYGSALDPASGSVSVEVAIASGSRQQIDPSLASNGVNYLVSWGDCPVPNQCLDDYDIHAKLLSAGPSPSLLPGPELILTGAGAQVFPRVASSGSKYLVAWLDARSGAYDIYGSALNSAGSVVSADFLIADNGGLADYDYLGDLDATSGPPGSAAVLYTRENQEPSLVSDKAFFKLVRIEAPAAADFNADGATDVSVYRPAGGLWFVKDGQSVQWGGDPTDKAVPAGGFWHVKDQFSSQWGDSNDKALPLPSALRD